MVQELHPQDKSLDYDGNQRELPPSVDISKINEQLGGVLEKSRYGMPQPQKQDGEMK